MAVVDPRIGYASSDLAERITKGLLVSAFENDSQIEKLLDDHRSMIEGTIRRELSRLDGLAREEERKMKEELLGPIPVASFKVSGPPLERLDPDVLAFFRAIGKFNKLGDLEGVSFLDSDRAEARYWNADSNEGAMVPVTLGTPSGARLICFPIRSPGTSFPGNESWEAAGNPHAHGRKPPSGGSSAGRTPELGREATFAAFLEALKLLLGFYSKPHNRTNREDVARSLGRLVRSLERYER